MQVHLIVFTSRYRYEKQAGNSYLLQNQPLSPPTDKTLKYHLHYYSLPNITWNLPDQAIFMTSACKVDIRRGEHSLWQSHLSLLPQEKD